MSRFKLVAMVSLVGAMASMSAGCGHPEDALVRKYFDAARLRDGATLSNIATVDFIPVVQQFTIAEVSPESRQPVDMKALTKELQAAQDGEKALTKEKLTYQNDNLESLDRVFKAESAQNVKLTPKDQEVQARWKEYRDRTMETQKRLSTAKEKLDHERQIMALSVGPGIALDDVEGNLVTETVSVNATVKMPEGPVADKIYVLTLVKYDVKNTKSGQAIPGRWIITRIVEVGKTT